MLRGLEAKTGKVVSSLKGGHEVGSKIRSIWCGMVDGEEWAVSGGLISGWLFGDRRRRRHESCKARSREVFRFKAV